MGYLSILGILIGSLLVGAYILYAYRGRNQIHLADATILFLAGSGFIAGIKVIIFAFNSDLLVLVEKEGIDIAHIFLGGLAICWVSVLSAIQIIGRVPYFISNVQSQSDVGMEVENT